MAYGEFRESDDANTSKKKRRCFQRVISGIERGGVLRFITLTSGPDSPEDIQRSWRTLYMRLYRRGLISGYIKVPEYTKKGRKHLHVIYRGKYIDYFLIKQFWQEIHSASIVDIRQVKRLHSNQQIANEMAKYMAKDTAGRYGWSWGWVWRGFCNDWKHLKSYISYHQSLGDTTTFTQILQLWRWFLHQKDEVPIRAFLAEIYPGKDEWTKYVRAQWGF